ncbi:MAG: mono/diheme cytochrome c family protein, partial [Verrucomicrobiales bacterium]
MNQAVRIFAATLLFTPCAQAAELADTAAFLEKHCFECHDSDSQKGKLDLTALKLNDANFETWVKIHDRVRSGEMPPAKKPRPESVEKDAALAIWAA